MRRGIIVAVAAILLSLDSLSAQSPLEFEQLPREVRDHAIQTRQSCRELNPDLKFGNMQGIEVLSLTGDGARDIVVDNEGLCGEHIAGGNCTNRGCDMTIYKEISPGRWRKIFEEHLHAKFIAIDWEHMRFQLMVASIYAGDRRCRPTPNKNYTSGQSCNLIVTYRDGTWHWQPIK